MKFAAIDIGSNAIRLLFTAVYTESKEPIFKKTALYRYPIRLGEDVFRDGKISEEKYQALKLVLRGFKNLIDAYGVIAYRACATSAMREAENSREIIEKIAKKTGINIDIIEGKEEARIINSNQISDLLDDSVASLYVDVGGGSTEVTLFDKSKMVDSRSFNIGTVRILSGNIKDKEWSKMETWITKLTAKTKPAYIIGSGGNINKLYKLANEKKDRDLFVSKEQLLDLDKLLNSYSLSERITELGLNPDRADVILPANHIFLSILNWANCDMVYVPKIGLADGIVKDLYWQSFKD